MVVLRLVKLMVALMMVPGTLLLLTSPATLTEIAIQGNGISSATIYSITINNEVLVENSILTQALEHL